ncbi:MAG TPA: hypothetical protein VJQ82_16005 [Terriglobales bacterium]|nr:hypothetical protein [Terriglobales bacterium]
MRDQELDRWLDEALGDYADVEPRAGLENRMLARLASEKRRTVRWWGFALSMAVLAIVVFLWLRPQLESVPAPEVRWTAELPPPLPIERTISERQHVPPEHSRHAAHAKRERFPSPSPLTEQEKLLARFVQQFPQRAALIARAQTELYKQDQEEMARPWPAKGHD